MNKKLKVFDFQWEDPSGKVYACYAIAENSVKARKQIVAIYKINFNKIYFRSDPEKLKNLTWGFRELD
jgi:hypothetical protein